MSLQNEHRPVRFQDIKGNQIVVHALQSHLRRKGHSRVLLFSGPAGCGKTTLARLVAAKVEAYDPELPVDQQMNYQEVDSADFRGIETVRNIRRRIRLAPVGNSPYRVWLFDEVHGMTPEAQKAMLKTLESPPPHVYILLATTDPQKLIAPLKRRCTPFEVKLLSVEELEALLTEAAHREEKKINSKVISQIAEDALGSPGMALMLLDKVIGLPPEKMLSAAKHEAENKSKVIDLCRSMIKGESWKKISAILRNLEDEPEESIRRAVLGYCASVLLKEDSPRAYLIMDSFSKPFYDSGRPGLVLACYEAVSE